MHFLTGVVVAIGSGLAPWAVTRLPTRWALIASAPPLVLIVAGAVFGLKLYPLSDVFVGWFSALAGIALGRALPARFRPLLALLLALSVLDVAQNLALAGPSVPSTGTPSSTAVPDPHFVWLNFRLPLPGGHFNIGFADLILIAAVSENLRRRGATPALTVLPGVIAVGLGEGLLATLPPSPPTFVVALAASVVVFLTAGYGVTELAVTQMARELPE